MLITQDAVDILDTLLDPRNDISFQDISTQVGYLYIQSYAQYTIHTPTYYTFTLRHIPYSKNLL